jgi:hypothetical protein
MSVTPKSDLQLVPFLRNLADSIEKEQLLPEQIQKIGEFYMSYKLTTENSEGMDGVPEGMDVVKFLTLGWYMYTHILNNENTHENELEID